MSDSGDSLPRIQAPVQLPAASNFKTTAVFILVSMLAYVFTFAKSLIIARYFGTGTEMDAFTLAFLIPNLLNTLITGGFAISLVPALAAAEIKGPNERANTFRVGLLLFVAVSCAVAALLVVMSRATMALVAPGFDAPKQALAAGLLRWCALLLPLSAVYAYCSAELLSRRKYASVAAAPIISTAGSIAALVLFPGAGIKVLPLGLAAGMALQALAVAAPAWRANRLPGALRWRTPEVRELTHQQLPMLLISSFGVINVSVDQFMAGLLPSGSAAALNFGNSLSGFVMQAVVMAASWVVLPELSRLVAQGDHGRLARSVRQGITGITLLAIPVATAIFILGGTAVRLLFQHGRFDSNSTRQVSAIWIGYTLGLLPVAVSIVPVRLINALQKNQFLVKTGICALVLNAGLDYLLMRWLGPVGIALSTSVVFLCSSLLVLWFVHRLAPGMFERKLWTTILRALLVCAPLGAALWAFRQAFPGVPALVVGGLLFAAAVLATYHWCGLLRLPFDRMKAAAAP